MTYPLDETHLAALREVCAACEAHGRIALLSAAVASSAHQAAADALSSPSASAHLVRDLLGACEVDALHEVEPWQGSTRISIAVKAPGLSVVSFAPSAIPALILALLDALALPEGRKEAALDALREAGR